MTLPKRFEPVRMPCSHYPDFCPRNAIEGSDRCELHQQRIVAAAPAPATVPDPAPSTDPVPLGDLLLGGDDELRELFGNDLDFPSHIGRRRRALAHVKPPQPREGLLTFDPPYAPGTLTLTASPQRPFKPRGLMLWNVGEIEVEAALIGNQGQLVASCGRIPGQWFATSQNFEQVCEALKAGKEPARGWGDWDALYPGVLVRLTFSYPVDAFSPHVRALMWGHVLS
jgi:hypothetical protein